jgi:hypothetical protein
MKALLPAAAAAALLLAGCGGGGGNGSQPASMSIAEIQGFWDGPITGSDFGGAGKARVVVLENGATWIFLHDDSTPSEPLIGIATVTLSPSGSTFAGTGRRYPASGNVAATVTVAGNDPGAANLLLAATTGMATSTLTLVDDVRYKVAAVQADVAAGWGFTKEGGNIVGTWTVASGGILTGSTTLGCTYSGTVVPHAAVAVFDVAITETCSGSVKQLGGIAKLNSAKTFLTFGLTTSDGAQAEAFAANKL